MFCFLKVLYLADYACRPPPIFRYNSIRISFLSRIFTFVYPPSTNKKNKVVIAKSKGREPKKSSAKPEGGRAAQSPLGYRY